VQAPLWQYWSAGQLVCRASNQGVQAVMLLVGLQAWQELPGLGASGE